MANQIDYYSYYCFSYAVVRSGGVLDKILVSSDHQVSCSYAMGAEDAKSMNLKSRNDFSTELARYSK